MLGVREQELVSARALRVEEDAGPTGEPDPLDVRPPDLADEQDERAADFRVVEFHVDLARRRLEPHLDPDGRHRFEHEKLRQIVEGCCHGVATTAGHKSWRLHDARAVEVKSVARLRGPMATKSTAEAAWEGDLPHGKGRVKGVSGGLAETSVSWAARTGTVSGLTTPEELLAAAQASCFAMALSAGLGRLQKPPEKLGVRATATFDKVGDAWKVTTMEIEVVGKVPGLTAPEFEAAAKAAGDGCPISGVMKGNVALSVRAFLE